MDLKPFIRLTQRRAVIRPGLPADLAEFYALHEGIGLDSSTDYPVRMCGLDDVERVGWTDLYPDCASKDDFPPGWENFAAFPLGVSPFGAQILYVLDAPCCPPGSILAIGRDIRGPGGVGPYRMEGTLVLAESFPAWLAHLEQWGWVEYALAPWDPPPPDPHEIERYYLALNPGAAAEGSP